MITDKDIEKLKVIFTTKEDFHNLNQAQKNAETELVRYIDLQINSLREEMGKILSSLFFQYKAKVEERETRFINLKQLAKDKNKN